MIVFLDRARHRQASSSQWHPPLATCERRGMPGNYLSLPVLPRACFAGSDPRRWNAIDGNLRGVAGSEGGSEGGLSRQKGRNRFRGFRPPARIFFQALQDCPFQGRLNFGTQF